MDDTHGLIDKAKKPSDEQVIDGVYLGLFDRKPDPEEMIFSKKIIRSTWYHCLYSKFDHEQKFNPT